MDWNLVHAILEALIIVAVALAGRYPRIKGELIALEAAIKDEFPPADDEAPPAA